MRHARYVTLDGPFRLQGGGELPEVRVCFETWGEPSPARDNAVLVCHAISGDSHAARHEAGDDPGWWESVVGPGKPVDTDRHFVVCSNVLGGCRGTTGPNFENPATGRPYGADFPAVTVADMVRVQAALLDRLEIERLRAVVGGSLGGFQALEWATAFPDRVSGCIALATAPRLSSQAIAFDVVGRNAITHDANFNNGQYYDGDPPGAGLAIARMLAHVTYLSLASMEAKFNVSRFEPREIATEFEKKFSVGSYLAYQGDRFVERFDANSYVTLSMAMDLFDLGGTPAALADSFADLSARTMILSFSSDWLYPPSQSREIVEVLASSAKRVTYCDIESRCGHDAFLLDDELEVYGEFIRAFLAERAGDPASAKPGGVPRDPRHIFDGERLDHELVLDLVPEGAGVLDLGCGDGGLLDRLRQRGHWPLVGVELDESAVLECAKRGHDVIQSDLDRGLSLFADAQFDVAVLSQTLQAVEDVAGVLRELVRVSRRAIVSFPNFAHRPLREMFYREGRIPKSEGLYQYEWHDSPNRRFPSIRDFEELCGNLGIRIERSIYIDSERATEVGDDPNLNADIAIVVLAV